MRSPCRETRLGCGNPDSWCLPSSFLGTGVLIGSSKCGCSGSSRRAGERLGDGAALGWEVSMQR